MTANEVTTPGQCRVSLRPMNIPHLGGEGTMLALDMLPDDDQRHAEVFLSPDNLVELGFRPAPVPEGDEREVFEDAVNVAVQRAYVDAVEDNCLATEASEVILGAIWGPMQAAGFRLYPPTPAGMDQRAAFDATVELARAHNMEHVTYLLDPDLTWRHLLEMQERIHAENFSPSKLGRWLGWAQAAVVAASIGVTLEDVKRLNRNHADGAPAPTGEHNYDNIPDHWMEASDTVGGDITPFAPTGEHDCDNITGVSPELCGVCMSRLPSEQDVERVARAIYAARKIGAEHLSVEDWSSLHEVWRDEWRELARAAIAAMGGTS